MGCFCDKINESIQKGPNIKKKKDKSRNENIIKSEIIKIK